MTGYKRQHWNAQSYLRRFSSDGRHLWMLDKPTLAVARPSIRDISQTKFFNDAFLRDESGVLIQGLPEGCVEQQFGIWEEISSDMASVAFRVANGGKAGLEERGLMATCVALQFLRTQAFRKLFVTRAVDHIANEANAYLKEQYPEAAEKLLVKPIFPPKWASALHHHLIWESNYVPLIAADLFSYIWRIGVNDTAEALCTSDTPVISFVHDALLPAGQEHIDEGHHDVVRKMLVGNRGMRGIEVIFPLSPGIVLLMYHPGYFEYLRSAQGRPVTLTTYGVRHYNALQLLQCERQLYSRDNTFDSVRDHAATFSVAEV